MSIIIKKTDRFGFWGYVVFVGLYSLELTTLPEKAKQFRNKSHFLNFCKKVGYKLMPCDRYDEEVVNEQD